MVAGLAGITAAYRCWNEDNGGSTGAAWLHQYEVRRGVTALLRHADLLYGALDFIVTPSGEWIFLELNPNGQWAWIKPTRHLITAAIADLLTE